MNELASIQLQIEELQKKAAALKAEKFDSSIAEIKALMQTYSITIADLGGGSGKKARAPKQALANKEPVAVKFIGPNGETWSGRGLQPRWLTALVAQGRTKEEFSTPVAV